MADRPLAIFSEASASFQKQLKNGKPFPLLLSPSSPSISFTDLASALKSDQVKLWLDTNLAKCGAVLLRGFPVASPEDFSAVVESLGWEECPYVGAGGLASRTLVTGRVMTANDGISFDKYIGFHNEGTYMDKPPTRFFFFCETPPPPGCGGSTPIVPGHVVYDKVVKREELAAALLNKGRVSGVLSLSEEGWKTYFGTDDKQVAESKAMKVEWLPNGGAKVCFKTLTLPMFKEDRDGRMSIFTGLGFYVEENKTSPMKIALEFEDGSEVSDETAELLVELMRSEEVSFPWEKGDILLIDNTAVLHSREICSSSTRRILVAITY